MLGPDKTCDARINTNINFVAALTFGWGSISLKELNRSRVQMIVSFVRLRVLLFDNWSQKSDQAKECMPGMPGYTEAMKAVVSCDKPGGAAHTL